jgi:hypothetical protein
MQAASGYYIARDSAGNTRRVLISYSPKPDTNPPQLPFAPISAGLITQNVFEQLPWDRGLKKLVLAPGAKNLVIDSVRYFSKNFARAYLRIPIRVDSSSGCLIATDSVGNQNTVCYVWSGAAGDTLAPIFRQLPLPQPMTSILGTATERRAGDIGLKTVTLTPIANTQAPVVTFSDKTLANVSVVVPDTLNIALCKVEATDSAGNFMRDTLRYAPRPDILAPVMTLTAPTLATRLIGVTEIQAWDRGIASISLQAGVANIAAAASQFTDARHGSILLTITNLALNASAQVVAVDSAGNRSSTVIFYSPSGPAPLVPLTLTAPYDFGTLNAGQTASATITLTNPNAVSVTLTKLALTGSDSVFALTESVPITFASGASSPLYVTFAPKLLGSWKLGYALSNDTMLLATVSVLGRSVSSVVVKLDSILIAKAGDVSQLTLRIQASNAPLNLDSLGFTLSWDHDVASLGTLTENCSAPDTGLCNYSIASKALNNGDVSYLFVRKSPATSPSLAYTNTAITLPITATLVARATSTLVSFSNLFAGRYATATGVGGLISLGSICADSTLRAKLDGNLAVAISSIQPNPARDHFAISLRAACDVDVSIDLMNVLGHKVYKCTLHLNVGETKFSLPIRASLASGTYVLRIRTSDGDAESRRVIIER